jgi:hypothetical protein
MWEFSRGMGLKVSGFSSWVYWQFQVYDSSCNIFTWVKANPSLDGTIGNVTPQIFCTHSTSHKSHSKKIFTSNFMSKDYRNHVKFETSIRFTKV